MLKLQLYYSSIKGNSKNQGDVLTILSTFLLVTEEILESFRFEDEDEDGALCFRHNEIFKLFRPQPGRDDEVDCNNIVTPSLSRI